MGSLQAAEMNEDEYTKLIRLMNSARYNLFAPSPLSFSSIRHGLSFVLVSCSWSRGFPFSSRLKEDGRQIYNVDL